ncbi:LysR family transcriptional regulator [Motiliproteus sp. MSK22-1]|uniref:LysR family transcriptional regulator n=1 Tax=Motiliproteus sp. MSK22-1 TaxID=1897630 RepID=UPI00097571E1|nr:LysR family transcriptional regulator [Motiliproteus sp. MSK22-1]OMH38274.1 transcriptional regulator [Motiliproteus sp. MSK22-1]
MEILALKTFIAVVEEGGILSASKKLNTVQSNVTTRIRRLEEELSVDLFFRKGRGLELAPAGRVLMEYAQKMLYLEKQASNAVSQAGGNTGLLRIGSMETFAAVRLPGALKRLRVFHPELDLSVETSTTQELLNKVLCCKLDCAFVGGPIDHSDLLVEPILVEELVLVRSRLHPDASGTLILFREGCAYRAKALAWKRESGQQIGEVMELGTLEGILGCVTVGLGCTLMPRTVVENSRFADELIIKEIPDHLSRIPTVMVSHRESPAMLCMGTLANAVVDSSVAA